MEEREKSPETDKTIYKSVIGELLFLNPQPRASTIFIDIKCI